MDLNGTFGLVREYVPSEQRWGVRCAGQVLDVAIAAKNLVRATAKELGGNLRQVLSKIEYDEVSAVLALPGADEDDDSEGSSPRNRTRERRPPDSSTTPGKRRKVKSPEEDQ